MVDRVQERSGGDRFPVGLGLLLAGIVVAVILAVNWISPPETAVSVQQFQRLLHDGVVERIGVSGDGLRCRLERPVRLVADGRSLVSQQVLVAGARPNAEEIEGWKAAGVTVESEEGRGGRGAPWLGLLVVVGLLGLGSAYLWTQARKYQRIGSPRQRLAELEEEFRDGSVSVEEYQERCEAILAEM